MRSSFPRFLTSALRPAAVSGLALALTLALSLTLGGVAAAQDEQPPPPGDATADQDPPGRVARVSLTQGAVSLQPAGTQDWANADVNRPLTTGDKLWTDQDSKVELDIGSAAIRMGSTTGFSFLNLDDHTAQMQVTAGTLIVRVRSLDSGETFEVDTPNLAVSLVQPGQYRVQVNDAGDSTVVEVSEGEAQASGNGQGFPIHAQQRAEFAGTDQLSSVVGTLGAPDDLDAWSLSRDRLVANAQSQQYVSPEATGYADLDNNGRWENTPDYGYVWTPTTVEVDWAPYRFGHWVWISPWGWTWVDNAPWGFAPFHYGRWVNLRNSWCWVPGPRRVRPVYAPALVGWVGRPGVGLTLAIGAGVSWFPLGPREVYVPAYRVSPVYVQRVNITNTTIVNRTYITNVYENRVTNITYVNRGVRGAVTSVPQSVFTSAQPVGRNRMNIPEADLRGFRASGAAPAIAPARQSLVGAGPRGNFRPPPAAVFNRTVVARTAPPRPPVSFDRQSEAIRANGGRPLGRGELTRLQPANLPPASVRVIGAQPSMADRERAIRDNRTLTTPGGGNRQNRPEPTPENRAATPVSPRQGLRGDRPPAVQSPQGQPQEQAPAQQGQPPSQDRIGRGRQNDSPQQGDRPQGNDRSPFTGRGLPNERPQPRVQERPQQPQVTSPPPTPPSPTPPPSPIRQAPPREAPRQEAPRQEAPRQEAPRAMQRPVDPPRQQAQQVRPTPPASPPPAAPPPQQHNESKPQRSERVRPDVDRGKKPE